MVRTRRQRYLLDVWVESRMVDSLPALVRGRLRDLTNDRETYVGSIAEVEAIVEAELDAQGVIPRQWERDRDV